MAEFDPYLTDGVTSVLLWSEDRTAASVAAFALARRSTESIVWLNLRAAGGARDAFESIVGPFMRRSAQIHTPGPFRLRNPGRGAPRPPGDPALAAISPFLAHAIDTLRREPGRRALLMTGCDRISPPLMDDREALSELIRAARGAEIKVIMSHTDEPRCRGILGAIVRIDVLPGREWRSGMLSVEESNPARSPIFGRARLELLEPVKPFLGRGLS